MKLILSEEEIIKVIQNRINETAFYKYTITSLGTKCGSCGSEIPLKELEIYLGLS